jgi:hypothetical protein
MIPPKPGWGAIGELYAVFADGLTAPEYLVEALEPSMQVAGDATGLVVFRERVFLPIECKLTIPNAVAEAADAGSQIAGIPKPAFERVVAVCHIREFAGLVWNLERYQDRTVFGDLGLESIRVGEGENTNISAIRQMTKRLPS